MAASPTNFDTTRLRFGDMIAGIAAVVLLISLFLGWYSVTGKVTGPGGFEQSNSSPSGNAFDALSIIPILLLLAAVIVIALVVLRALNMMPSGLPVSPGAIILGVSAIAFLLVLFRLIVAPDFASELGGGIQSAEALGVKVDVSTSREFGIFIALIAAAAATVGGWLDWNEEGRPMPGSAGSRGSAPAGGPALGGGQPGGGFAQPPAAAQPPVQAGPATTAAAQPAAAAPAAPAGGGQPADWYPDPRGEKRLRYWDGKQWTDHTAD